VTDFRPVWDLVRRCFAAAETHLPSKCVEYPAIDTGCRAAFEEYLDCNELGLALDELAGLGEGNGAPPEFWALLLEAAEAMNLQAQAEDNRMRAHKCK
jgi:hypothetical protein